jgi:hypothetical protein
MRRLIFLREEERANAAIDAKCSEQLLRAQPINLDILLHALAAQRLRQERKICCHLVSGDAAVRSGRA